MNWMGNVVDLCIKGGIFMIPLFAVALFGLILVIERLLYLRENRIDGDRFHFELKNALKEDSIDQAIALAARTHGVIGRVLQEGLLRIKAGEKDVETATEKAILAEMVAMEKSRGWIVNMSQIAPLLGILGTVWGLVVSFMAIEKTASTDPRLLAGGIYQALITTVAGLVIAIPLTVAQEHVRKQTNTILGLMDLYIVEIKEWLVQKHGTEARGHGQT